MNITDKIDQEPIDNFLETLKHTIQTAFYEQDNINLLNTKRGFPAKVFRDIMSTNPFSVAIPEQYGGRGAKAKECLAVLDTASYESLPLSLMFGINLGLFLSPVAKYGQEIAKREIFKRFLTKQNMGGLMITEPDYGSDALNMQTQNTKEGSNYVIKGTKHWQGLTGMADYWLITSRYAHKDDKLGRDIDFFISDSQQPNQQIKVSEYYNNFGLRPIPYGKNIIDITVSENYKLIPHTTGLKLMMDLLHRSRFQFPGMGMGFIRRMLDEAINHCTKRFVGGKPLIALDQVKHQISRIQSAFTICSAMCSRSAEFSGIENDLSGAAIEANSIKAYITDLMQESAQTLTQLSGANGYKAENIGGRGIMDSRPFQIFEGSNDMLYTQISDMVIKSMKKLNIANIFDFMTDCELTKNICVHFKNSVNFKVDTTLTQRKMVDLGKIISRIVAANQVFNLGNKGFRSDLIANSIETITHEISMLVASYKSEIQTCPIIEYNDNSLWLKYS